MLESSAAQCPPELSSVCESAAVAGYCGVLSSYLQDACGAHEGSSLTRTVLFGLQRPPLDGGASVVRLGDDSTVDDVAPYLVPFLVTNARECLQISAPSAAVSALTPQMHALPPFVPSLSPSLLRLSGVLSVSLIQYLTPNSPNSPALPLSLSPSLPLSLLFSSPSLLSSQVRVDVCGCHIRSIHDQAARQGRAGERRGPCQGRHPGTTRKHSVVLCVCVCCV